MLWSKIRSALEWGLFYGVITWFIGTGVSNRIPGAGVWSIVINRVVLAVLIVLLAGKWKLVWWVRGVVLGLLLSIPLGYYASQWPFYNDVSGWGGALITGAVTGVLIEFHFRRMEDHLEETQEAI